MTVEEVSQQQNKYVGKVFPTKSFGDLKVLKYNSANNVEVEFLNTGSKRFAWLSAIIKGEVRDTSIPTECGVGFVDIEGAFIKGVCAPEYKLWTNMLQRCYSPKILGKFPAYRDCTVSDTFKYYSNFKTWCTSQKGFGKVGWHLDKDILVKGNKVYSEDTCCFVPPEINCLMTNNKSIRGELPQGVIWNCTKTRYRARLQKPTGWVSLGTHDATEKAFQAYKLAKEAYVKEVANKWKDQLDHKVYEALMNWRIEIND